MKFSFFFIFILLFLFTSSCEGPKCKNDYSVTIKNNLYRTIYFEFYWKYPDTMIGNYNPINNGTDGMQTGETFLRGSSLGFCWEDHIGYGKKQYIHFFDADSLKMIPWDTVRKTQRGLLERREFDLEYLIQHNWTITYP